MSRRTKIVCTLGPAVNSEDKIAELIAAGMNVARINCSHGSWDERFRWIEWVRKRSPECAPVAVLVDLQGPKFRIGDVPNGSKSVEAGRELTIGKGGEIPVQQPAVLGALMEGARILLGDGDIELRVTSKNSDCVKAVASFDGTITSRMGITVVGVSFECEALNEQDRNDVAQACKAGVDYIALSYVCHSNDMAMLRSEVAKHDPAVRLCAKIETRAGLNDLENIIRDSDAVMVARGDMGLQMPIEDVPLAQKKIIRACRVNAKPVITATQMLESMIHAPRPTRAEAADVANAILDGSDALMLSAETAVGQHPIESVQYMARISEKAETMLDSGKNFIEHCPRPGGAIDHTEAVAHGVAQLADLIKPTAIVTSTTSGRTAILVSKYRPRAPILCAAWDKKVQAQMALAWGVETALVDAPRSTDEQISSAVHAFVRLGRLKSGDQVIVSAGTPPGTAGNTNLILVHTVK